MAKFSDEEEVDLPVERKRRRPKKRPVSDDEDVSGGPRARQGGGEDEEEENSLSTGIVVLDILLDFRDDCIDWSREHLPLAIGIVVFLAVLVFGSFGLMIRYVINYANRPTLTQAFFVYDLGSYAESKRMAESVLRYAKEEELDVRSGALFVLGAATCAIADTDWRPDRRPGYLAAANYLQEAAEYGFLPQRRAEGYYLLGKSLYLAGELSRCRRPFELALEFESPNTKQIHWYLANAYFLDSSPNYGEALRTLRRFRGEPTITEEERYEADLLQTLILLQYGEIDAAERVFLRVPIFERYGTMRHFISGQIDFLKARRFRQQAEALENEKNPISLGEIPIAPAPVLRESSAPESEPGGTIPAPEKIPPVQPEDTILIPEIPEPSDPEGGPSHFPEGSVFPILPVLPLPEEVWSSENEERPQAPIVAPLPIIEEEPASGGSIFDRMRSLRHRRGGPYADQVQGEAEPEKRDTNFDPDCIVVEPSKEIPDAKTAPMPAEFAPDRFTTPAPIMDPVQREIGRFRELAQKHYQSALDHFLGVQEDNLFNPRWRRTSELLEGLCYEESGRWKEATQTYLHLADGYPETSEAAAANFLRGEIERKSGKPESALTAYSRTFQILRNEPHYTCPWLPKQEIIDRSAEIVRNNVLMKEYREALTLLHLARDVMPAAVAARLRGEVYENWAEHLASQASRTFGESGEKLAGESREKYRRAGESFEDLARAEFDTSDYDEHLWRSAENYRLGRDFRRGVEAYRRYLKVNLTDHQQETYLYLGELYLHLHELDKSIEALRFALQEFPNNALASRIRIVLARALHEEGRDDEARETLLQNLIGEYSPASAVYRDSVFLLARFYFEDGHWNDAIPFFEDALKNHPNAIQTADGHYSLALSYLKRQEETEKELPETVLDADRRRLQSEIDDDRARALANLERTEEILVKRQADIGLTESEQAMLRNSFFISGSLLMKMQRFEEAITLYNIAATRYQELPESLDALMQIVLALRHLNRSSDAFSVLNRMEVVLNRLEKSGTIPSGNNWASLIEVQKNLVNLNESPPSP